MRLLPSGHAAPDSWALGVLHPGKLRPLRLFGWAVALVAITLGSAQGVASVFRHVAPTQFGPARLLHVAIVAGIALALYALAVRRGERRPVTELAPRHAVPDLALGLIGGFVLMSCVMLVLVAAGGYTLSMSPAAPPWLAMTMSLGSGVMEELLFRGIVFRLLWGALGLTWALVLSAIVFGLMHLLNPDHNLMGALSIIIEAGILLAAVYAVTARLFAPIGMHIAWNFTQGYVFGAQVSGTDFGPSLLVAHAVPGASALLTGGSFGPEASLPGVVVGLAAALALLWYRR